MVHPSLRPMDGGMTCEFTSFSTVFQSHQDNGLMTMNGCVQWNPVAAEKTSPRAGPKVIKPFSCSTQLSMKFFLLINVKMPTIVGILMSGKNSILSLSEPNKSQTSLYFYTSEHLKFHAQLS